MKRTSFLGFVLAFLTFSVYANGPANKVTGSILDGAVGRSTPNFIVEMTAHEGLVMKNGKTRPAKGMLTAYHLTKSNRYYAVNVTCVNVLSETDAVFVGPIVMAGPDWEHWIGYYRLNWVHDDGEPGAYADEFHTGMVESQDDAMNFCEDPPEIPIPQNEGKHWTVFEGNIQIHYRDVD